MHPRWLELGTQRYRKRFRGRGAVHRGCPELVRHGCSTLAARSAAEIGSLGAKGDESRMRHDVVVWNHRRFSYPRVRREAAYSVRCSHKHMYVNQWQTGVTKMTVQRPTNSNSTSRRLSYSRR